MGARHLQNETSEVTDSDVQDYATVIGQGTQSIFLVTNNDNDIHGSVQIQDILADVLSPVNSTKSQNTRANELVAKLMAEDRKLADRLTKQLQHEITKLIDAIGQLREETRYEIQSVRDDLNKRSVNVDERVSRHTNSTKQQHDSLREEINTELNVTM
jgi:ribosomal protein L9